VLVPDGYTYAEKDTLLAHAQALVSFFRAKTPYREHDPFLNYILVYAYSTESGTDQCDCSIVRDTAMRTRFPRQNETCGHTDNRCLFYGNGNGGPSCDPTTSSVNIAAADSPGPADLSGYRLPAEELSALDEVYTWSLHVAHQAVQDAGLAVAAPGLARAGIVLGNYTFPTRTSSRLVLPLLGEAVLSGLRSAGLPVAGPTPVRRPSATDVGVGGLPALVAARFRRKVRL
jgi:hypothetical protein